MKFNKWINWSFSHPLWTLNLFKVGIKKKFDFRDHNKYKEKRNSFIQIKDILAGHFKLAPKQIDELIAQYRPIPQNGNEPDKFLSWGASPELCLISYCLCKLLKPEIVVETGTAKGVLASAILQALNENNRGTLFSLELPPFGSKDFSYAGSAIPQELKSRWELRLGPSMPSLKKLIKEHQNLDIFIHDSDHSYWNQKAEYKTALPAIKNEGILISDDIGNDAFFEIARSFGKVPLYIMQRDKKRPLGFLVKK